MIKPRRLVSKEDELLRNNIKDEYDSTSFFDFHKTTNKFDEIASRTNSKLHLQHAE